MSDGYAPETKGSPKNCETFEKASSKKRSAVNYEMEKVLLLWIKKKIYQEANIIFFELLILRVNYLSV